MAGIWNINGAYDVNTKKITSKLSFEVGQVFLARIAHLNENNKEILLKMLDGWQFSANIEKSLNYIPNGICKFQVTGFEDGKLKISMIPQKSDNDNGNDEDSIENAVKNINIDIDKDDYELLKSMIKHDMPITKENILKVKTIIDFKEKITSQESEEDNFINNYFNSRGIDKISKEGIKTEEILKSFFAELKSISSEDVLTMLENNIDITKDNLQSFNKIFKGEQTIYNELANANGGQFSHINTNESNDEKNLIDVKEIEPKDIEVKNEVVKLDIKNLHKFTVEEVKNEISSKTEEMKAIIRDILDEKNHAKSESYEKIINNIKSNTNDFKIFNTVSNQYYYMDIPMKMDRNEYSCKLLIKDERKKEKNIDSKNVKIAASVKTVNLGTVDAYLKVNNNNMNVNLKCQEKYISLLGIGIDKLQKDLSDLGYTIFIDIGKKENEVSLTECRDFFGDNNFDTINTLV